MQINSSTYWTNRYKENNTPWDMGSASPSLTGFLQNLTNKKSAILIPGAGNGYESEWLWNNDFSESYTLDISSSPLDNLKSRIPRLPSEKLILDDFFQHQGQYDLIVEQTFFCALPPALRENYVSKAYDLLKPGGKLVGVLFDFPLTEAGPPFGGSLDQYIFLFSKKFKIYKIEPCYNSIKPRLGKEFFIHLIKP